MEVLTAVAPYAALAVTIGVWISTQRANRKHEVFKERVKRRVDMFDGLLMEMARLSDLLVFLQSNPENQDASALYGSSIKSLGEYRVKMFCYGIEAEITAFEAFKDAVNNKDHENFFTAYDTLINLVRDNLRSELDIQSYTIWPVRR